MRVPNFRDAGKVTKLRLMSGITENLTCMPKIRDHRNSNLPQLIDIIYAQLDKSGITENLRSAG